MSLAALTSAAAVPNASLKRQVSQLRPSYDFVVVGGGTSGLTVADRLTEALTSSKFKLLYPQSSVSVLYHLMLKLFDRKHAGD